MRPNQFELVDKKDDSRTVRIVIRFPGSERFRKDLKYVERVRGGVDNAAYAKIAVLR